MWTLRVGAIIAALPRLCQVTGLFSIKIRDYLSLNVNKFCKVDAGVLLLLLVTRLIVTGGGGGVLEHVVDFLDGVVEDLELGEYLLAELWLAPGPLLPDIETMTGHLRSLLNSVHIQFVFQKLKLLDDFLHICK